MKPVKCDWGKNTTMILQHPGEFAKKMPKSGGIEYPLKFAALNILIYSMIIVVMNIAATNVYDDVLLGENGKILQTMTIIMPIVILEHMIGIFFGAAATHISVFLMKGKGSFEDTLRIFLYGSAYLLFMWVPIINIIPAIFAIYYYFVALMHAHKISWGKTVIVTILLWVIDYVAFLPVAEYFTELMKNAIMIVAY